MSRPRLRILVSLLAALLLAPAALVWPAPAEEAKLLNQIRQQMAPAYKRYEGIHSLRHSRVYEYDAQTGELVREMKVTAERRDFFYRYPEVRVLSYEANGVSLSPEKFSSYEFSPPYPVFDEQGESRYHLALEGLVRMGNENCYRVRVDPKRRTGRHFSGYMYFHEESLDLVYLKGTLARLTFGLREFEIEFHFTMMDGTPVFEKGVARGRAYVPFFQPDRRLISYMEMPRQKLIPRPAVVQ